MWEQGVVNSWLVSNTTNVGFDELDNWSQCGLLFNTKQDVRFNELENWSECGLLFNTYQNVRFNELET